MITDKPAEEVLEVLGYMLKHREALAARAVGDALGIRYARMLQLLELLVEARMVQMHEQPSMRAPISRPQRLYSLNPELFPRPSAWSTST